MLRIGVDGTDREIDRAEYGDAPAGEKQLIIGHEAIGRVVETGSRVDGIRRGDVVVGTVRRPCPEVCLNCGKGEYDFCLTGNYKERGIKQLHGYMAELYAERPLFLIPIPKELQDVAVLLEPLSVVEKAHRQIRKIQERMAWRPKRALITGKGSIGLLAAVIARLQGLDVLLYSRGPARGAEGEIIEQLGAGYVDSSRRTLAEAADEFGAPDLAIEATGYSPFAWEVAGVLHTNGVVCLLSVTGGDRKTEIPADQLNKLLVLGNRLVFGSVNSHRRDFEQGLTDLRASQARWPGVMARFITRRLPLEQFREALDDREGDIKTVLEIPQTRLNP